MEPKIVKLYADVPEESLVRAYLTRMALHPATVPIAR
jgi:hypothetical protein